MTTKVKENTIITMQADIPLNRLTGIKYLLIDEPRYEGLYVKCDIQWMGWTDLDISDCLTDIIVKISYNALFIHAREMLRVEEQPTHPEYVQAYYEDKYKEIIEDFLESSSSWEVTNEL